MGIENLDEKYKPNSVREIVGQPHVTRRALKYLEKGTMPHLMLVGPPGVGKTSLAVALAKDLYGEHWQKNFYAYNASDNRGIDFVRKTISEITEIQPVGAPFQIVFLDEADDLTVDAQAALREIMQAHTATTKFILSCNFYTKIIEPIQDRCRVFRYKRLRPEDMIPRLTKIIEIEGGSFEPEAIEYIANNSKGSMRSALQHIETYMEEASLVDLETVKMDMPIVDNQDAKDLLDAALLSNVETYEKKLFDLYYDGGFSVIEILDGILSEIDKLELSQSEKIRLIWLTGEFDWRISQGSNDLLQMRCYLRMIGSGQSV